MDKKQFEKYMSDNTTLSTSSIKHYSGGVNTINEILNSYGYHISNLYNVTSKSDLASIELFLNSCNDYINKDKIGNRMYSNSLSKFIDYAISNGIK